MSAARVKYGSAFSRVISSKSALNHPFSIRNILNLDEQSGDDTSRDIKTITGPHYVECYSSPRKLERHLPNDSLTAPTPNLNFIAADNSWPAWVYATRYSRHGIPPANYTNPRRSRRALKRQKQRPLFSPEQLKRLEEEFVSEKYISKLRRCKLASEISLTEAQVRTWFQNRRTRWRKEVHEEEEDPSWTTHSGIAAQTEVISTNCMIVQGYCPM